MSNICVALNRPLRGAHPEETIALAAKADLLATEVAVDVYAVVMVENDASKLYEASSWAADIPQENSGKHPRQRAQSDHLLQKQVSHR